MKRTILLLLVLCTLFALAACGSSNDQQVTATGQKATASDQEEHIHSFGDWTTVKAPTCTENGEKQRVCGVCGEIESQSIPTVAHAFGEWSTVKEPTCAETGEKQRTCEICGEKESQSIPTIAHSFGEWIETKAPTDEEYGENTRTCSVCGKTETNRIDKLPHEHTFSSEWSSNATSHFHVCKCGEKSDVSSHQYGNWTTTLEPTITEEGVRTRVCAICGYSVSETIPCELSTYNTDPELMGTYSGVRITKLPYTSKGITVTGINAKNNNTIEVYIRNDTGKTITGLSSIPFKLYSYENIVQNTSDKYLEDLDPGESCYVDFSINTFSEMLKFGEADVRFGTSEFQNDIAFETVNGISLNKLPYTTNGIAVVSVNAKNKSTLELIVRNDTGKAITSLSSIPYKVYSSDGIVQSTGNKYLEDLDPGENCYIDFSINEFTATIKLGNADVREGTIFYSGAMETVNGISLNKLPYTTNGIAVVSVNAKNKYTLELIVRNNTGKAITSLSSIPYKVYSSDGIVQSTGNKYLEDLDPGESCYIDFSINEYTAMIKLGNADVRK